jgi:N6-L-threonylcarbamoyladenine synthase
MKILGIETSCDETAAAVVQNGREVLSHTVSSSLKDHQRYGGIIPEIASRRQLELINIVVTRALDEAGCRLSKIQAIAVTENPGLIGSLLVGLSYARALALAASLPLIKVNHIKAHLYANFLSAKIVFPAADTLENFPKGPRLPAVGLVISGGHTSLYQIKDFDRFRLLGQTRDDAVGEAFDKVARILGLGYPGGPAIDQLSQQGREPPARFSCATLPGTYDFSFSGIKTAVLYYHQRHQHNRDYHICDTARGFQDAVVMAIVDKAIHACRRQHIKTLLVGGGVAANSALRKALSREASCHGIQCHFPPLPFCLDNAAMIAGFGYQIYRKRQKGGKI